MNSFLPIAQFILDLKLLSYKKIRHFNNNTLLSRCDDFSLFYWSVLGCGLHNVSHNLAFSRRRQFMDDTLFFLLEFDCLELLQQTPGSCQWSATNSYSCLKPLVQWFTLIPPLSQSFHTSRMDH